MSIIVENVKNQEFSGATGTFTVKTTLNNDIVIDTLSGIAGVTIAPGLLINTNIVSNNLLANKSSNVTINFETINNIPENGKVKLTFPTGFDLTNISNITSQNIDGTLTTSVAGQVITITRSGGSTTNAGALSIIVENILNPDINGKTGAFFIDTMTNDDKIIDSFNNVNELNIIKLENNSLFKDATLFNSKKGKQSIDNDNTFSNEDFFGNINTYRDDTIKNKANVAVLDNVNDKIRIKMGSTIDNVDIEKTASGYKIGNTIFNNGDRYQQNGYTIEFKDGYIINSVKDSELNMLKKFEKVEKKHLSVIMNSMDANGVIKNTFDILDNATDNDLKQNFIHNNVLNDISLNIFRKKMIDVVFDTPGNTNLQSFIADSKKFLNLEPNNFPIEFKNKTKSHILKNKYNVDVNDIKNKITDDSNIYISTEAGSDNDEIKFEFKNSEKLKMKHEIDNSQTKKDKYTFTHESKVDSAQESGWVIKKYNNNTLLFEDIPTVNVFHKNDILELEKDNIKYTIQLGSSIILDVQDTNDYTPIVKNGSKLNDKYHTTKNRMFKRQFTLKGLSNAVYMSKDKNEELVLKHTYKDRSGDRLRRIKAMHIVNSKLSKS